MRTTLFLVFNSQNLSGSLFTIKGNDFSCSVKTSNFFSKIFFLFWFFDKHNDKQNPDDFCISEENGHWL